MKVLVTGGSGFIGSHLVDKLVDQGHDVTVLDRQVPHRKDVCWVDGDLSWIGDCENAMKDIDLVYHLAARFNAGGSNDFILHYFHDNLLNTINMLHLSVLHKVKRFLFLSTCGVYGEVPSGKATEEYPCNPVSLYASSKYAAERAAFAFSHTYSLPITIIRGFNVFGERQKPFRTGSVIPTFIALARENKDLLIQGDGKQLRDFLYVDDVANALLLASQDDNRHSVYNVSSGKALSIETVAKKIVAYTKSSSKIVYCEEPKGNPQLTRSVGNSSNFQKQFKWTPKYTFEDALRKVISHHQETNYPTKWT